MKKIILFAIVVLLLLLSAGCSCSPIQFKATDSSWTDNGVNAVYFSQKGSALVEAIGQWQVENPDKEIIIPSYPLYDQATSSGVTLFYRQK